MVLRALATLLENKTAAKALEAHISVKKDEVRFKYFKKEVSSNSKALLGTLRKLVPPTEANDLEDEDNDELTFNARFEQSRSPAKRVRQKSARTSLVTGFQQPGLQKRSLHRLTASTVMSFKTRFELELEIFTF